MFHVDGSIANNIRGGVFKSILTSWLENFLKANVPVPHCLIFVEDSNVRFILLCPKSFVYLSEFVRSLGRHELVCYLKFVLW